MPKSASRARPASSRRTAKRRIATPVVRAGAVPLPAEAELMLPHERDEAAMPETRAGAGDRRRVRQAARDVEQGLIDTEARGTPSNVPRGRRRRAQPAR